jgi:hypothetical protein
MYRFLGVDILFRKEVKLGWKSEMVREEKKWQVWRRKRKTTYHSL